ncbi:MAG TPA: nuclear transport factor 2 family protein [Mycobacterium sp.]|jgi:ketosteroid isomerase-like protein|nr:nuclear transport factor 2 family protein [Mycobacterium sp.]
MGATTRPDTRKLFATTDSMDVATVVSLFARDGQVVFGNGDPLVGIDEIRTGTSAFFDTIAGLHHTIVQEWNVGDDTIIELKVTYDRKDGQQVTLPCVTIFHSDAAGKIDDYRVYFDVAPIYA